MFELLVLEFEYLADDGRLKDVCCRREFIRLHHLSLSLKVQVEVEVIEFLDQGG